VAAMQAGDEVWLPGGEGRDVSRRQEAALQQGLLIFAVKLENPDQDILSGLDQCVHFQIFLAFRGADLLPRPSPRW
jgi:hypothetical protein